MMLHTRRVTYSDLQQWQRICESRDEAGHYNFPPPPWAYQPYGLLKRTPDMHFDYAAVCATITDEDMQEQLLLLHYSSY